MAGNFACGPINLQTPLGLAYRNALVTYQTDLKRLKDVIEAEMGNTGLGYPPHIERVLQYTVGLAQGAAQLHYIQGKAGTNEN